MSESVPETIGRMNAEVEDRTKRSLANYLYEGAPFGFDPDLWDKWKSEGLDPVAEARRLEDEDFKRGFAGR